MSACSNTVSLGTFIATNYVTFADGASLSGAALSTAGVTLSSASIVLQREGFVTPNSTNLYPTLSTSASKSATQTHTRTSSSTASTSFAPVVYTSSVDMLSVNKFVLIAATAFTNSVSFVVIKSDPLE